MIKAASSIFWPAFSALSQCEKVRTWDGAGQNERGVFLKKLKKSAAQMVVEARARIHEIETVELIDKHKRGEVTIVDIRDIRERQRSGFIPGSIHAPRGMVEFWVDPESPYHKEIFATEQAFVFHCASGWRSALTVATLQDMGFEAAHLKDGFSSWVALDGPIERDESKR